MTAAGKERSARILLLAALAAGCFWIFRDYLLGEKIMVFTDVGSDTIQQYIGQFSTVVNHIKAGTFRFYDLNYGMGTNILCLNLFDPGFILTVLAGLVLGTAHMLIYLVLVHILKIMAAGWLFYLFLSEHRLSMKARWAASFCYAFSGFILLWGQHYQFGTPAVYLPMILLFTHRFLKGKKSGRLLPAAVFLSAVLSVYFTYMSLILAGFYTLFLLGMEGGVPVKERIRKALSAYGLMLLGILMGMSVFLPTARILLGVSERLDQENRSLADLAAMCFSPDSKYYYSVLLRRLFSSNLDNITPVSDAVRYTGYLNYYEDPTVFTSAMTVFLCLQYAAGLYRMRSVSLRKRIAGYLAAALVLLTTGLRAGSIIMNGFVPYTYRYMYVLLPVLLLCAAWTWDRLEEGHSLSYPALAAGTALMVYAYGHGMAYCVSDLLKRNVMVLFLCGAVMVIGLAVCFGTGRGREKHLKPAAASRIPVVLIMGAVIVSTLSEGYACYGDRDTLYKTDEGSQSYFHDMYSPDLENALSDTAARDQDTYRTEKDFSSGTFSMDSLIQGYRGISVYNSILNKNLKSFFAVCYPEWLVQNELHLLYRNMPVDGWAAAFLGIRYILSQYPQLDENYFQAFSQFDKIFVFQNKREAVLGRFYTKAYAEASLKKYWSKETRQLLLGRGIALEDAPELSGLLELIGPKAYSGFDDIPGAPYQDLYPGRKEEIRNALLKLPRSDEEILMPIAGEPVIGDPDLGRVSVDPILYDDTVTGTVEADEAGYVLMMIPYEDGWELEIDGERTEIQRGDLGFIAWKQPEGKHAFSLRFTPPGLRAGLAAGGIGWLIYAAWLAVCRKKKRA